MADPPAQSVDDNEPEVAIEDVGPAAKRLTITISSEVIGRKLTESLGALANEATLPGFRRGKIPRRLLERRFGSAVRSEAKDQLIADAYAKAIEANAIKPIGEPEASEAIRALEIEEGEPLTFSLDVEVVPEFELPALDAIEIKKPLLEITQEHIEAHLNRQQQRLGTATRIESGFEAGDRISAHVTVAAEGDDEPLIEDDDALIICPGTEGGGRGHVVGLMIDDLAQRLSGCRVGQVITIDTQGPDAHELEALRGKKLVVSVRVTSAQRIEPATVEEVVEKFSFGTQDNLREQIKLVLQHQRDQEQAAAMRQQISEHLLANVDFELPQKLSAVQVARNLEGHRLELLYQGLTPEEVETRLAETRAEAETQARNRLKLFFLMQKLAEHFKVEVSEQEVNGRLAEMAAQHGQRPEQLRTELARTGRLPELARMVMEHKATDRVIANATITEVSAEEWNAMARTKESAGRRDAAPKSAGAKTTSKTKKKASASKTAAGTRRKKGS